MCNMPDGCPWPNSCAWCSRATAAPENNRDYVLSTVKSIGAQGFRDEQLHQLASMLHDDTPLHCTGDFTLSWRGRVDANEMSGGVG
jgi:hypothetical protein